jgi:hypothetical protein
MLSNCEAQFVSVPLRGNNLLPEWLREGAQQQQQQQAAQRDGSSPAPGKAAAATQGRKGPKEREAAAAQSSPPRSGPSPTPSTPSAAARPLPPRTAPQPPATPDAGPAADSRAAEESQQPPQPLQQQEHYQQQGQQQQWGEQQQSVLGGKAAAEALSDALRTAGCKPVGARQLLYGDWVVMYRLRDSGQAAVLPWLPALRAVNDPGRAVGSALATMRVLAAKGFPVVLGGEDQGATVAECLDLWT